MVHGSIFKEAIAYLKQLKVVDVDFCLTVIKPLHAKWLVNMFNLFTSEKGAKLS